MKNKLIAIALICASSISLQTQAIDGYDYDNTTAVEVEQEDLIKVGEDAVIYDYENSYRDVEITGISRTGNIIEVEVYDYDAGMYRYLEMED